jgi:hypothetical protein
MGLDQRSVGQKFLPGESGVLKNPKKEPFWQVSAAVNWNDECLSISSFKIK